MLHLLIMRCNHLHHGKFSAQFLNNNQKFVIQALTPARAAAFDSSTDPRATTCHPQTRTGILQNIKQWANDPHGKCILWLRGAAGTGKSTIARTVAKYFVDNNQLGASFFFKRGEGDRGNVSKFFATIAAQLVSKEPRIALHVRNAIDAEPAISEKPITEQFEKLVLQPLDKMDRDSRNRLKLFIVLDALDECEGDRGIKLILSLLSRTKTITSAHLRIFVTSRPELPVLLGFATLSTETHRDVHLQDIPQTVVENDIFAFLKDEFAQIRHEFNCLHRLDSSLATDWPSEHDIRSLAEMAVPLFIFAVTACRFVGDVRADPEDRLTKILRYQKISQISEFDKTYMPILDQILPSLDDSEQKEFREIVGSIVVLADPLSTNSLAHLLSIPRKTVMRRLHSLHSVLSVPDDPTSPVRMFHLSFREFLVDRYKDGKMECWFSVDEKKTHGMIATRCLQLLSGPGCLKANMCQLDYPGMRRANVNAQTIAKHLPAHVQYACRYWVYHLEQSGERIHDEGAVHAFLKRHFLHWLEVLSLIGNISDSIALVGTLRSLVDVSKYHLKYYEC